MENIINLIEKGKIRRYFRARNKPSFQGAISHITQHASGIEPLFLEESDYLYMLYLIKDVSKRFKFNVLSFALMLNHLHLLIKLGVANLSNAMKNLFQTYAMYFNKKYDRKGHVFSGAYRSSLCFDESYLLAASLYIHLNPVRTGLVDNPIDYRWSSCALFLNDFEKDAFIDYKFILSILDNDTIEARLKYKKLLEQVDVKEIKNILEQPRVVESIAEMIKREWQYFNKEENGEWAREHGLLGGEDLEKIIENLRGKDRLTKPQDIKARRFLIEQLKARGFNISEIAQKMDLSRQSIHNVLK